MRPKLRRHVQQPEAREELRQWESIVEDLETMLLQDEEGTTSRQPTLKEYDRLDNAMGARREELLGPSGQEEGEAKTPPRQERARGQQKSG